MIFNRIEKREESVNVNDWNEFYSSENGFETIEKSLQESTYFNCLSIISEDIAKCPIQVKIEDDKGEKTYKKSELYDLLRLRPNPYMTAIDCIKTFVALSIHNGISGLYIDRFNDGKIRALYPVKIDNVIIDNVGLINSKKENKVLYDFSLFNETGSCFESEIVILKGFTLDGVNTKAIKSVMKENFDTSLKSQKYLNNLFSNGLTNKIVVQLTSDVKEEKDLRKIQDKFKRLYSDNGRMFTVPAGFNVSAMNLSLADAQYEQLRRLSKEEIAGIMRVPLSKLGYIKENAKSEEQDDLRYLKDTLLVRFESIEQELDYKLLTKADREKGIKIRFNTNVLLRTDSKTQAEVISAYVKTGIYDLDYARGILGVEKLGGDPIITFPSGQVLLKDLVEGKINYSKGGDKNEGDKTSS